MARIFITLHGYTAEVRLDAGRESLNAVEGTLTFPSELLELKELRDGNSIVNFWLERPAADEKNLGSVRFSGVVPGGFGGDDGLLFRAAFSARTEGAGTISVKNAHALKNDGQGSPAAITIVGADVRVAAAAVEAPASAVPEETDVTPPEPFTPVYGRDPLAYDGRWFLAFSTQDKGIGIAYYEVSEGGRAFASATSPYALKDQRLRARVAVRAVDRSGNAREVLPAPPPSVPREVTAWEPFAAAGAIILLIIWAFLHRRLRRRERAGSPLWYNKRKL